MSASCLGCGYCCRMHPCELAYQVHGDIKDCPSLKWNGVRHICEIVASDPEKYARYDNYAVDGIGSGCSSSLFNMWREDIRDRTKSQREES